MTADAEIGGEERPRVYEIRYDPSEGILHLTLTELWTMEIARRFMASLDAAIADAARGGAALRILSDARAFPVQTQEVSELIAPGPASGGKGSSRTAVVVGGALNRMQATRTITSERIHVFTDMTGARAWLLAPTSAGEEAP